MLIICYLANCAEIYYPAEGTKRCLGYVESHMLYANEQVQFGKPIGQQEAIQQQLSVIYEL
jgi:alkylation response protein AidB-like acyl-CoA dehydrogenase